MDVFVRTRTERPTEIIIDLDPTDDPTHGKQQLLLFHGYYGQHQYFPMLIFEGHSGMPLGAWLRPGTRHPGCGAADLLASIVERLRSHWPDIQIRVRGDAGLAVPEVYEYCETQGLLYVCGYAANKVLKRRGHLVADLLHAPFREAKPQTPEVGTMEVGTARTRLYKAGALVVATTRRVWFRLASHWPGAQLFTQATQAVNRFVERLHALWRTEHLFVSHGQDDPRTRHRMAFAPQSLT